MNRVDLQGTVFGNRFGRYLFYTQNAFPKLVVSPDQLTARRILANDNIVAVQNSKRLVPDKGAGAIHRVAKAAGFLLAHKIDVRLMDLVAGSTRVPRPAAGITAFVTFIVTAPNTKILFEADRSQSYSRSKGRLPVKCSRPPAPATEWRRGSLPDFHERVWLFKKRGRRAPPCPCISV